MLFLQSITKHADKLTDFGDTKSKVRFNWGLEIMPIYVDGQVD